jgi:hypothetical protein
MDISYELLLLVVDVINSEEGKIHDSKDDQFIMT